MLKQKINPIPQAILDLDNERKALRKELGLLVYEMDQAIYRKKSSFVLNKIDKRKEELNQRIEEIEEEIKAEGFVYEQKRNRGIPSWFTYTNNFFGEVELKNYDKGE